MARVRTIEPRLLDRSQAAAYCGISLAVFTVRCPVRPLPMGKGKRLERYDIRDLDEWIDRLGARSASPEAVDWLEKMDAPHGNARAGKRY
jgi:hypothetical protein